MLDTQALKCQFNGMNKLPHRERAQALQMMAEGISLRAMTG